MTLYLCFAIMCSVGNLSGFKILSGSKILHILQSTLLGTDGGAVQMKESEKARS